MKKITQFGPRSNYSIFCLYRHKYTLIRRNPHTHDISSLLLKREWEWKQKLHLFHLWKSLPPTKLHSRFPLHSLLASTTNIQHSLLASTTNNERESERTLTVHRQHHVWLASTRLQLQSLQPHGTWANNFICHDFFLFIVQAFKHLAKSS